VGAWKVRKGGSSAFSKNYKKEKEDRGKKAACNALQKGTENKRGALINERISSMERSLAWFIRESERSAGTEIRRTERL